MTTQRIELAECHPDSPTGCHETFLRLRDAYDRLHSVGEGGGL